MQCPPRAIRGSGSCRLVVDMTILVGSGSILERVNDARHRAWLQVLDRGSFSCTRSTCVGGERPRTSQLVVDFLAADIDRLSRATVFWVRAPIRLEGLEASGQRRHIRGNA